MKKIILSLLFLSFTASIYAGIAEEKKSHSNVKEITNKEWYAIHYHRGDIVEYIVASMSPETFNKIFVEGATEGWVEFLDVHWATEATLKPMDAENEAWGYTNQMILPIRNLTRIIKVKPEYLKKAEKE